MSQNAKKTCHFLSSSGQSMQVSPLVAKLNSEKRNLERDPIPGVTIKTPTNDIKHWVVDIDGPAGSYYEGDTITVIFDFGQRWPAEPPKLVVMTPVFHPNIYHGAICIDVLRHQYGKAVRVRDIISGIINALEHPNANEKLNMEVGALQERSEEEFAAKAREQVNANILARESGATLKLIDW